MAGQQIHSNQLGNTETSSTIYIERRREVKRRPTGHQIAVKRDHQAAELRRDVQTGVSVKLHRLLRRRHRLRRKHFEEGVFNLRKNSRDQVLPRQGICLRQVRQQGVGLQCDCGRAWNADCRADRQVFMGQGKPERTITLNDKLWGYAWS